MERQKKENQAGLGSPEERPLAKTPGKVVLAGEMDTASPDLQNPSVLAGSHKSVPNVRMMCLCWTEAPNVHFILLSLCECMS